MLGDIVVRENDINVLDVSYLNPGTYNIQIIHDKGVFNKATNAEMYHFNKENLDFDQIIWEFGDDDNPDWVHVSYVSEDDNRRRCLQAYKENNKTKYKII